ncbi:U6 snRNA phosphodiesterase 1 isoform X1 [Danaus plexippus]|uniref:U6 snRNA phosphodiesterase 1 isoform X1 n=1 Tax=Danaus plexippus TaxID=13037 RepID=UPI002AB2A5F2|nr:U6 snRNA phosphodiesterase 1 isoform X1 [Danaus plexippus]
MSNQIFTYVKCYLPNNFYLLTKSSHMFVRRILYYFEYRIKLPTPNLSEVSVVSTEEHIDEPSLHGGRLRSFPHVRGNWPSFIYIEYPEQDHLHKTINKLSNFVSSLNILCNRCDGIHLSLSKTFTIQYHMIKPLSSALQEVLGYIESFELFFDSVEVYCNEEKTRTFIALKADIYSSKILANITDKIDDILDDYKLPKFYKDPSFHISILSVNGNKKNDILRIVEDLNKILISEADTLLEAVNIEKIILKTGNKYFQYHLKNNNGV